MIDSGGQPHGLTVRPADFSAAVVCSAANTYTGDTQIIGGVLRLEGGANRLPVWSKLVTGLSNVSGILDLNGNDQEVAGLEAVGTGGFNSVTQKLATECSFR